MGTGDVNFGKLRFNTEYEQQIWGECGRLITNYIICYNAIFSSLLAYRNSTVDIKDAAQLKNVSPVAWQHINLYGRYEKFNKRPEAINAYQAGLLPSISQQVQPH